MQLKMNRIWIVTATLAFGVVIVTLAKLQKMDEYKSPSNINIVTTYFPYEIMGKSITQNTPTKVTSLTSKVKYELTPEDKTRLDSSNLVVHIGPLDANWMKDYLSETSTKTLELEDKAQNSSKSVAQSTNDFSIAAQNSLPDPSQLQKNYSNEEMGLPWISPNRMLKHADLINTWLGFVDNGRRDQYTGNYRDIRQKLVALDDKYYKSLRECRTRSFATSSGYLYYLAKDYNLDERIRNENTPKDVQDLNPLNNMLTGLENVDSYFNQAESNLEIIIKGLGCTTNITR